ncbi:MAG: hypothetical protein F6K16_34655 [Symploca sp. SIO2B6]|nr:hypothetical protein [Symploca sp. SIO2B6]
MLKVAHVINVAEITEANKKSYLHIAQPVTIKSMIVAKQMAKELVDVELWAVKHKDECVDIPSEFRWAQQIEQYAYEYIEALKNITPPKPLPRVVDILLSLYESSEADYFIYTNLDIGLYPDFYVKVKDLILEGYDAFCINRVDLPKIYKGVLIDETTLEMAFASDSEKHPGVDCFVFKREIVPKLNLSNVYVGFAPVGQVLKTQVESNSKRFLWVKDQNYTFHLGSDMYWKKAKGGYADENRKQADGLYVKSVGVKPELTIRIKNRLKAFLRYLIDILK